MIDIKNLKINIESKVLESEKMVIIPHNKADFDAVGSAIGLSLIGNKLKKKSCILLNDPIYIMERGTKMIVDQAKTEFDIIDKQKYLKIKDSNDLFVLTDVNGKDRISIPEITTNPEKIFVIDHHDVGSATITSNNIYIDSKFSSASEIVYNLLAEFKIKISPNVANYLLAGIYLDTNRLTKNTESTTMMVISKLMSCGASLNDVREWVAEDFESYKKVESLVLKIDFLKRNIAIVQSDDETEYASDELAKAADRSLCFGSDAAFAIGKISNDTTGISARSYDKVDVGEVMRKLVEIIQKDLETKDGISGGGNPYSAAAQIKGESVEEIGKRLVKMLRPPYYTNNEN